MDREDKGPLSKTVDTRPTLATRDERRVETANKGPSPETRDEKFPKTADKKPPSATKDEGQSETTDEGPLSVIGDKKQVFKMTTAMSSPTNIPFDSSVSPSGSSVKQEGPSSR